jgi:hypothetical protein
MISDGNNDPNFFLIGTARIPAIYGSNQITPLLAKKGVCCKTERLA